MGVKTKVVVGGKTKSIMMNAVFEDIDILVATPGALGKLSTVGIYKLHEVMITVIRKNNDASANLSLLLCCLYLYIFRASLFTSEYS